MSNKQYRKIVCGTKDGFMLRAESENITVGGEVTLIYRVKAFYRDICISDFYIDSIIKAKDIVKDDIDYFIENLNNEKEYIPNLIEQINEGILGIAATYGEMSEHKFESESNIEFV